VGKLLLSLSIITVGLLTGYAIQRIVRAGKGEEFSLARPRRALQRIALLGLNPIAALGAIWIFELGDIRVALMPVMGVLTLVVGGVSGLAGTRVLKLPRKEAGAFFSASAMFNIGSIGALIVFIFLGEQGFALVPLFRLFEEFCYYAFGFPIAKSFSPTVAEGTERRGIRAIVIDPFVLMTVGSITLGFVLNILNVPRPAVYASINTVVIPVASFLLLVSIGMAMRFSRVGSYVPKALIVAAIKFGVVPVVVGGIAWAVGMGQFDNGLPLAVIIVLSSMPVGFIALVPPSIYDLDVDLANAAWLVTTAFLAVVIPLQMFVIGLIGVG
jgi:predicted permease